MQKLMRRTRAMSRRFQALAIVAIGVVAGLYLLPITVQAAPLIGNTERVSLSVMGEQGNADSGGNRGLSVSLDGRLIAFDSHANNLVEGDSNKLQDVFVRDRKSGKTERISISSEDAQANGVSGVPSMSSDGRFVAFLSTASNIVADDTNGRWDVFVRDRITRTTERVSVSSTGDQGNGSCWYAQISSSGRYVVFTSASDNLVAGDTNRLTDVFVYDRERKATERVNIFTILLR